MKWASFIQLQNLIYLCLYLFMCVLMDLLVLFIVTKKYVCVCVVVVHNVCPFEVVMVSLFKGSRYCYCWFVLQPRLVLN